MSAQGRREFARHVVPAILKPLRTLWNEVIGFLFFCLAVLFGSGSVRAYMAMGSDPHQSTADLWRFLGSSFLALLMLYFCVSSFLRARKISRS